MRRTALPGMVLASILLAPQAFAGPSPEQQALADSLYAEGGRLMGAKRWAEACPKIDASFNIDPGIGSAYRLGYCYENLGRNASAWSMYHTALAMARKANDKRAAEIEEHLKQVEPQLAWLLLDVAPENKGVHLEIKRDGQPIDFAAWSSPIPIDPGQHVIEATAEGKAPFKQTIEIARKPGKTAVRVPALVDAAGSAAPAGGSWWTRQRTAGAWVGGAGLAVVAVGGILGGIALSKMSTSKQTCRSADPVDICDAAGLAARQDAQAFGSGSTAVIIAGGVIAAAGIVVIVSAPSARPASTGWTPRLRIAGGPGGTMLSLEGGF